MNAYKIFIGKSENLKGRDHLKQQDVDGRILLKCILKK
jgi:hypothetical protein